MGYTLQALVARKGTFPSKPGESLEVVGLEMGYEMIPLGALAQEDIGVPFCPFTDEGRTEVPEALGSLCARLSERGAVAYIEAELFGGLGTQANILYSKGRVVQNVVVSTDAINTALRWLGLEVEGGSDEFDAAGLGRHRSTDQWLK